MSISFDDKIYIVFEEENKHNYQNNFRFYIIPSDYLEMDVK